jgi:hypothetical protein
MVPDQRTRRRKRVPSSHRWERDMTNMLVPRLVAAVVLMAATPAAAAEWRGTVGDWDLRADRFDDGAPYCYAGADRGPGDRLTLLRSEVGLAVILTRRDWDLAGHVVDVEVAVDDRWRDRRRAALDPRTLMLTWAEPAAVRAALARGLELSVTGHTTGRGVRWSLAGSGAALEAIERCWRTRQTAFDDGHGPDRDPFHTDTAPRAEGRDSAVDRDALAAEFEAWLDLAAATYRATVTPQAGEPARFRLETILGAGEIRLIAGATHDAVLNRATAVLRAACAGAAAMADHGRLELNEIAVRRTRLACDGGDAGRLEAVAVSWPEAPGGLVIIVPDPGGRGLGADFTAAVTEDLAASEGLSLVLRSPETES